MPDNWAEVARETAARTGQKFTEEEQRILNSSLPDDCKRDMVFNANKPDPKPSKFRNVRVQYDGKTFDSVKERDRWQVLCLLQMQGAISGLVHHKRFLLSAHNIDLGQKYEADFFYMERGGTGGSVWLAVVEDVKPTFRDEKAEKRYKSLPHYRLSALKQAILRAMGYEVREV